MAEIPDEAVKAALAARSSLLADRPDPTVLSDETLMRKVLEAAAPAMAEHVAGRITAHKYEHEPKGPLIGGRTAEDQRRRTWRRHFGIAARVAANAFCTPEDARRLAAKALERGEVITCQIPESGEDANPVAGSRED